MTPRQFLKKQTNQVINQSSRSITQFRQFLFAPNLLTFVISVVVGNSFGSTIKELVNTISGTLDFIHVWIFSKNHLLNYALISKPFGQFFNSLITMIFIAFIVFYTIKFINDKLIVKSEEKWGYNQAHDDALKLHKQQEETIDLQRKILKQLEIMNSDKQKENK
ncbi:MscL family protein [Leuconostoc palmae]|uniref:MscL family protein n=1 Tax=Leuconostoc palmae TaxID=501487 RepID=UPI001C7D5A4E|nr:MscL family protein [Leuconostoc palmae]